MLADGRIVHEIPDPTPAWCSTSSSAWTVRGRHAEVSLRNLAGNKVRLVLSLTAIALSVAFVADFGSARHHSDGAQCGR